MVYVYDKLELIVIWGHVNSPQPPGPRELRGMLETICHAVGAVIKAICNNRLLILLLLIQLRTKQDYHPIISLKYLSHVTGQCAV